MFRKTLTTLILGTALAVASAASASPMLDGGSSSEAVTIHSDVLGGNGSPVQSSPATGTTQAEYRALMIRSQALNDRYGNAVTDLTPQQFSLLYQAGVERLSPQQFAAIVARSQAQNERYGVGTNGTSVQIRPDILGGDGGVSPTTEVPTASGDSFAWGTAAIGAAALTAAMLLSLAFVGITRRRHRLGF